MNFNNQIDLLNKIMPNTFMPDEFRIDKNSKDKNMKKHFEKIETAELLEIYFEIHYNYRASFVDEKNEILTYVYEYIKKTIADRGESKEKYIEEKHKHINRVKIIMLLSCIVYYNLTKRFMLLNHLVISCSLCALLFFEPLKKKFIKYGISKMNIDFIKTGLKYLPSCAYFAIIYSFRNQNSIYYLSGSHVLLTILHLYYVFGMRKFFRKMENKKIRRFYKAYTYGFLLVLVILSVPSLLDTSDCMFHTPAFIEGVCTNIEKYSKSGDFYVITINDTEVLVAKDKVDNKNNEDFIEIGNYYVVRYGELTKAVATIEKRDMLNNNKENENNSNDIITDIDENNKDINKKDISKNNEKTNIKNKNVIIKKETKKYNENNRIIQG